VGVSPGPELNQLVAAVWGLPGLRWDGLLFYPGHLKHAHSDGVAGLSSLLEETLAGLRRKGHEPAIVSGGSTPTLFDSHQVRGLTEIRPGTYIFNDRNCVVSGCAEWEDCAASVLVTVVSTARPGQMIVDGGSKTFSSDGLVDGSDSLHGRVIEAPEARFLRMNEEHGYVALEGTGAHFQVGDRVRIIPNHICVAVNLHEKIYGIRGDQVEHVWTVEARGKLQ
jgi:D-serine deaminase-like pyridoxal phosphate-dependent protein